MRSLLRLKELVNVMKCSVKNCKSNSVKYRKFCHSHRARYYRYGDPKGKPEKRVYPVRYCSKEGCGRVYSAKGYCKLHYTTIYVDSEISNIKEKHCSVIGCTRRHYVKNLCYKHHKIFWHCTDKRRYRNFTYNAKKRGIEVQITFDIFKKLIGKPCFYCETDYICGSSGFDRINNDLGYTEDNIISACGSCNRFRNVFVSVEEFKMLILQLQKLRNTKDIWNNGEQLMLYRSIKQLTKKEKIYASKTT